MTTKMYIIPDIWDHIKSYMFPIQHNIQLHGRHLKKDPLTRSYNEVVRTLPRICRPEVGPQILYSLLPPNMETIRLIYHVPVPSFRRVLDKDLWEQCVGFCPRERRHYMVVEKVQYVRQPSPHNLTTTNTDQHIDHAQYYRDNLHFHQAIPLK